MITTEQEQRIRTMLADTWLCGGTGPGLLEAACSCHSHRSGKRFVMCSMQTLNLAICSSSSYAPLPGMSPMIAHLIVSWNDGMDDAIRNSDTWRELIVQAAKTSDRYETVRHNMAPLPSIGVRSAIMAPHEIMVLLRKLIRVDVNMPMTPDEIREHQMMQMRAQIAFKQATASMKQFAVSVNMPMTPKLPSPALGWTAQDEVQYQAHVARTAVLVKSDQGT